MRAFHSSPPSATTTAVVLAGLILWSLASCAPKINVTTRLNTDIDYEQLESFAFEDQELSLRPSWVDAQIKMDVERILKSKGYTLADSSGPDLLVSFQTQRNESYPVQLGRRRRKKPASITFGEGSLTLEIRDSFNQPVYRGVARDIVAAKKEKTRQRLRAAVDQLLNDFPERE
jgi:hypothetical protein